jgi:hypothetical protein
MAMAAVVARSDGICAGWLGALYGSRLTCANDGPGH